MSTSLTDEESRNLLRNLVREIVFQMKDNHDLEKASMLIIQNQLSFEDIIKSTVKLSIENLAVLADKVISKK